MVEAPAKPLIELLPYQRVFFEDRHRVVVAKWSRQAGKDFTASGKAVNEGIETHQPWYLVATNQRQADESFAKAKQWAEAYKAMLKLTGPIDETAQSFTDWDREIDAAFEATARTLHLPGGGKVVSLPGRDPDNLAGLTGNVILTEFALFRGAGYNHWRVLFPLTTRGYQILAISSARGRNTKFADLCHDPDPNHASVHVVTILDAVRDGLVLRDNNGQPCSVEEFRRVYNDEAGWRREFLCEETGDLDSLVKWGMLEAAAQIERPAGCPEFRMLRMEDGRGWDAAFFADLAAALAKHGGRLEIGWDVARTGHLSSLWVNWHDGRSGSRRHLVRLVLMHGCEFSLQRQVASSAMDTCPRNVGCGDSTGLGMDSNETLAAKYPSRWEGVNFGGSRKREIASAIRTAFGDGDQSLPPLDSRTKCIATDLYALQVEGEVGTGGRGPGTGTVNVVETENPLLAESHCDIAFACGLARRAAAMEAKGGYLWIA